MVRNPGAASLVAPLLFCPSSKWCHRHLVPRLPSDAFIRDPIPEAPVDAVNRSGARCLGLRADWRWLGDPHFRLALAAGVAFWGALLLFGKTGQAFEPATLLSLILLRPVVEELLFRGLLQGWLRERPAWRQARWGVMRANLAVSVVFTALHFIGHPPLWAAGVLLPSLLFGYFRDRHDSVWPAIALHVFYNTGCFLLPLV